MTEVYEVATFYAHFDVVKEGETPPPAVTVRVCDSLSCAMAGAESLLERLPALLGKDVRVVRAPCMGACDKAPVAAVGHAQVFEAGERSIGAAVQAHKHPHAHTPTGRLRRLSSGRRLRAAAARASPARAREETIKAVDDAGLRGLGGAGFPTGRKWTLVRQAPGPRLMAVNGDEGEPGTFKDRYYLGLDPHRFIEGMLIAAWVVEAADIYVYLRDEYPEIVADAAGGDRAREGGGPHAARNDPSAPRRGRLHLRRRVRDDRVDRGQARPAAPSPAVCRAGRPVRPADARAERRDACTGCATSSSTARSGSPRKGAASARASVRSRCRAA